MQNGFIKSFNGPMRDELLDETLFFDLDDTRTKNRQLQVAEIPHPRGLCRPPPLLHPRHLVDKTPNSNYRCELLPV